MKDKIQQAITDVVKNLYDADISVELSRPDEQFGDFATNVSLQLAGIVGKPPRVIADEIVAELKMLLLGSIGDVSVAGPGFINITLSDSELTAETNKMLYAAHPYGISAANAGKKILVEYSDPNPMKPLHAGHLYTTLVGDAIARLVEQSGAEVIRLNYGGDVGLHVAKSLWAILREFDGEHPDKLQTITVADRPTWLGARYVEGNTAYEDDLTAKDEIMTLNKRVYVLQSEADHDSPLAQIYWTCRQWSYDYFAELYKALEVIPFDRFIPESEVTALGHQTVLDQKEQGVYQDSDGAVIFDGEKHGLHTRVFISSQGLPMYEAKEVGLLLTKWRDYHFDKSIVITANEQEHYMRVVLKSIEQFEPEAISRTVHLTHGVVKLQGGVKMSSRKGNTVTALDIIESAQAAGKARETPADNETVLAAIKYALLKARIGSDIIYDPAESIALEGNSGPYLQYAHARACSILKKAEAKNVAELPADYVCNPSERTLMRKLTEYPEIVEQALADLMPHHICTYLYETAQIFNRFYENNRVIGDDHQSERLALVAAYARVLRSGLNLLGITAPERM